MKVVYFFIALTLFFVHQARADLVIVVNPAMNEEVTMVDIARIFTGRSAVLQPVNLIDAHPMRSAFDQKALGRSSAQVKAHWAKLAFTGKGTPPPELASEQHVIDHVANNEFAVGYVHSSNATDSVKIIHVLN